MVGRLGVRGWRSGLGRCCYNCSSGDSGRSGDGRPSGDGGEPTKICLGVVVIVTTPRRLFPETCIIKIVFLVLIFVGFFAPVVGDLLVILDAARKQGQSDLLQWCAMLAACLADAPPTESLVHAPEVSDLQNSDAGLQVLVASVGLRFGLVGLLSQLLNHGPEIGHGTHQSCILQFDAMQSGLLGLNGPEQSPETEEEKGESTLCPASEV